MYRVSVLVFFILLICLDGEAYSARADQEADYLCETAPQGIAQSVPAPFDKWMVLVCPPQGQALVPIEGAIWVTHGTQSRVAIMSQPPEMVLPPAGPGFNPRVDVRFKSFASRELLGERRTRALKRLGVVERDMRPRKIDHIYQLDALSSIYDVRMSIYAYVQNASPNRLIICLDECTRMMEMDVLRVERKPAHDAAIVK